MFTLVFSLFECKYSISQYSVGKAIHDNELIYYGWVCCIIIVRLTRRNKTPPLPTIPSPQYPHQPPYHHHHQTLTSDSWPLSWAIKSFISLLSFDWFYWIEWKTNRGLDSIIFLATEGIQKQSRHFKTDICRMRSVFHSFLLLAIPYNSSRQSYWEV